MSRGLDSPAWTDVGDSRGELSGELSGEVRGEPRGRRVVRGLDNPAGFGVGKCSKYALESVLGSCVC